MFQIVRYSPVYHHSTDGIIGTKATRLPMTYSSLALACKLAGVMSERDYNSCGDDAFYAVPVDGDVWNDRRHSAAPVAPAQAVADDMPW